MPRNACVSVRRSVAASLIVAAVASSGQAGIISDFSADADGWSNASGFSFWRSAGGNPGGYFEGVSATGFITPVASAPSKFLGARGDMLGAIFTLDIKATAPLLSGSLPTNANVLCTVTVTLHNAQLASDGVASWTSGPAAISRWRTFSVSMEGANFGMTDKGLASVLDGVTDLTITVTNVSSPSPFGVGFDNVGFLVPTPGSAGLLALAAAVCLARRRR